MRKKLLFFYIDGEYILTLPFTLISVIYDLISNDAIIRISWRFFASSCAFTFIMSKFFCLFFCFLNNLTALNYVYKDGGNATNMSVCRLRDINLIF